MPRNRPIGNEDWYKVKCKRCGFWCDLTRDSIVSGTGINIVPVTQGTADDPHVDEGTNDDPVVTAGCPQCGTGDYTRDLKSELT